VNFQRRFGKFSNEFTPSSPKPICADIWVRSEGGKIIEKFPKILEKAQREWLLQGSDIKSFFN